MNRPTWNDYYKEIALVTKKRSPCERLQVGCVLVKDNRIVSQGYNGFLPSAPHKSIVRGNRKHATVHIIINQLIIKDNLHAEQNAITDCAKRGVSCNGCTAYITHYPCIICTRIMLASGIKHIKYINDYKNDELVKIFCDQMKVTITKFN